MASPAIDAFITFRFLKLLVTPFDKTEAYRLGIIDKRGKVLRKYKTLERIEERQAYTILHRLVFNIKKLIEKVPGGKSRVASYAAALFLIKEQFKFLICYFEHKISGEKGSNMVRNNALVKLYKMSKTF